MPLHIYRAGFLQYTHERKQMDRFLRVLISKFERDLAEVSIIIDVNCGSQLDALVFKDQVFVAIEMKNVSAHLILPGGSDQQWEVLERGRRKRLPSWGLNQPRHHREAFAGMLWDKVFERNRPSWMREDRDYNPTMAPDDLRARICSWVVVNSEAEVEIQNLVMRAVPWFDALPMDQAARSLQAVAELPELISQTQFVKLLGILGAQETTFEDWLARRAAPSGAMVASPRVPRIDLYLDNASSEKIVRGLGLIAELRLDAYAPDAAALTAHTDSSVRRWALDALISLRGSLAGGSVGEALHDLDGTNRDFALGLLTRGSYPEALPSIESALPNATGENLTKLVKALTNIGGPAACKILFKEAKSVNARTPLEDPVPRLPFVRGLGEMKCVQGREMISDLLDRGLANRNKWSPYVRENVVHACIEALGQIGTRQDRSKLERLLGNDFLGTGSTLGIDWTVIHALGEMGDPGAANAIIPFLEGHDKSLREQAIRALARLRSKAAFQSLIGLFRRSFHTDDLWWQLSEALTQIDPEKFERHLVAEIRSRPASAKENRKLLQSLWKIATPVSTETLFSLLSAPETCEPAGSLIGERLATQSVRSRARGLLTSENEYERIGAIWLLQRHWRTELVEQLARFEADGSAEVRRNVAQVYAVAKTIEAGKRLVAMSGDPDEGVRIEAFNGLLIAERDGFVGEWAVSFDDGAFSICKLIAGRHGLIIRDGGKMRAWAADSLQRVEASLVPPDWAYLGLLVRAPKGAATRIILVHDFIGEAFRHVGSTMNFFSKLGRVLEIAPENRISPSSPKTDDAERIARARKAWEGHHSQRFEVTDDNRGSDSDSNSI